MDDDTVGLWGWWHSLTKLAFHANAKLKKMDGALKDLCMKINKDTKDIKHQYKMSRDKAKEIYKKAGGRRLQPVGIVQEGQSNQRPWWRSPHWWPSPRPALGLSGLICEVLLGMTTLLASGVGGTV